jgi:hypothetical protein
MTITLTPDGYDLSYYEIVGRRTPEMRPYCLDMIQRYKLYCDAGYSTFDDYVSIEWDGIV